MFRFASSRLKKMFTILGILYGWVLYVISCTIWACVFSFAWYILLSVLPCIVCLGSPHWTQGITYTQEIPVSLGSRLGPRLSVL